MDYGGLNGCHYTARDPGHGFPIPYRRGPHRRRGQRLNSSWRREWQSPPSIDDLVIFIDGLVISSARSPLRSIVAAVSRDKLNLAIFTKYDGDLYFYSVPSDGHPQSSNRVFGFYIYRPR